MEMSSRRNIVNFNRMAAAAADMAATGAKAGELGVAAQNVIAKRMGLGLAAMTDPANADHAEFARMVPEKVEAFATAGTVMLERSAAIGQKLASYAMAEARISGRAMLAAAASGDPAALARAQARLMTGAAERMFALAVQVGAMGMATMGAMLAPVHSKARANDRRLK
jgi:hypothetical protein